MQRIAVLMAILFVVGCSVEKMEQSSELPREAAPGEKGFIGQTIPVAPLFPPPDEIHPESIDEVELPGCMTDFETECVQSPQVTDWTCPTGWVASEAGENLSHLICKPPVQASDCEAGEFSPLGTSTCSALGDACSADGWPTSIPGPGQIIYVKAGAAGSGASSADPLGSIQSAILAASSGATILVGTGTYTENLVVDRNVTIRGTCAKNTRLIAPATVDPNAVTFTSPAALENMTITGDGMGVLIESTGTVQLTGVSISNVVTMGLNIIGTDDTSRVELKEVYVGGVTACSCGDGFGVSVSEAELQMRQVVIEDVYDFGIDAFRAKLDLQDVSVRDVYSLMDLELGAIFASETDVVADRVLVFDVETGGYSQMSSSKAVLTNFVVGETGAEAVYSSDSELEISQFYARDCATQGVIAFGSSMTMERFLIRDIQPHPEYWSTGIMVMDVAEMNVSDGALWNTADGGIDFTNSNVKIEDVKLESAGLVGVWAGDYSISEMTRVEVNQSVYGIVFYQWMEQSAEAPITAILEDITVRNSSYVGIYNRDSTVIGTRVHVENVPYGVASFGEASLTLLSTLEVEDSYTIEVPDPVTGEVSLIGGIGVWGMESSTTQLTDSGLVNNEYANIWLSGEGAKGELYNVASDESLGTPEGTGGFGVLVEAGAYAEMDTVAIKGNFAHGILVTGEGSLVEVDNLDMKGTKGIKGFDVHGNVLSIQGVAVKGGAEFIGAKGIIEEAGMYGVYVDGEGSKGSFDNYAIKGSFGTGAYVGKKGFISLDNSAITGSEFSGIVASGEESEVQLGSVMTKGSKGKKGMLDATNAARLGAEGGDGLAILNGAKGVVSQSLFTGNERFGVLLLDGESAMGSNISFSNATFFGNSVGINANSQNFSMSQWQGELDMKGNGVSFSQAQVGANAADQVNPNMLQQLAVQANVR